MNGNHPIHIINTAYEVLGDEVKRRLYDVNVPLKKLFEKDIEDWDLQQKQKEQEDQRVIICKQGIQNESVHCYIIVSLQVIMGMDGFMHQVNRAHEHVVTTTTSKYNNSILFFLLI